MKQLACLILSLGLFSMPTKAQTPFWQQTSDSRILAGVLDLAADTKGVVYAGAYALAQDPPWAKGGVYRSTDDGGSWEHVGFDYCPVLATKGDTVFVIRRSDNVNTLYHSTTNGAMWHMAGSFQSGRLSDLLITRDGLFFAATESGIFRSLDGGITWTPINNGLGDPRINCLAEKDGAILAGSSTAGTFRSTNSGASWSGGGTVQVFSLVVGPGGDVFSGTNFGVFRSGDGGVTWAASGLDANNVYCLATTKNAIVAGCADGVHRSSDRGQSWAKVSDRSAIKMISSSKGYLFVADPSSGYEFVIRSFDLGSTWHATGFTGIWVLSILPRSGGDILAAAYGSFIFRSTDLGARWVQLTNGLASSLVVCLTETPDGLIFAGTDGAGIFRSSDSGANWIPVNEGLGPHTSVFALSSDVSGKILAACNDPNSTSGGVYVTADLGQRWNSLRTTSENVYSLCASNDGFVAAGTAGGKIHLSTDHGANWTPKSVANTTVRALLLSARGTLFAGSDYPGAVWRSDDRGSTWAAVSFNRSVSVTSLAADQTGAVWAGTYGEGAYRSTDGGKRWLAYNNGLKDLNVLSISVSRSGYVLAGTRESGVFRSSQPVTSVQKEENELPASFRLEQNFPNPFNPTTVIEFSLPVRSVIALKVMNVLGQEVATLASGEKEAGIYRVAWNASGLPSGSYFYRLQAGELTETKKLILIR
jgi:photosystem II stability/assembly factor-like uncharacterized protein